MRTDEETARAVVAALIWVARWDEHGATVEQIVQPEHVAHLRASGVDVAKYVRADEAEQATPKKLIGHEPNCAIVVGKPCDCGGIWR